MSLLNFKLDRENLTKGQEVRCINSGGHFVKSHTIVIIVSLGTITGSKDCVTVAAKLNYGSKVGLQIVNRTELFGLGNTHACKEVKEFAAKWVDKNIGNYWYD